ncbi:hypothetical protein OFR34_14525 [Brachyspira hyodysenteriae]|nr:hypothetical protein [Brachyspira hyodysenteriae]MDA0002138.1 hypothetical protein [Brachyspira hyodysenteriae]
MIKDTHYTDVWNDIPIVRNKSKEELGYPTQKPSELFGKNN